MASRRFSRQSLSSGQPKDTGDTCSTTPKRKRLDDIANTATRLESGANHSPGPKRFKFRDASTVKIFVGPQRSAFVAHKDLLCKKSEYFRGALLGQFVEASKNEVTLTDQDADAFEVFLQWLYKGSLEDAELRTIFAQDEYGKWTTIIEVYMLAEYLQVPELCESLRDFLQVPVVGRYSGPLPGFDAINLAFSRTTVDSGLRKLIVSLFVSTKQYSMWMNSKECKDWLGKLPVDFCHDLLIATSKQARGL